MTIVLLGVLFAVGLGVLIGSTWTMQVLDGRFRRGAMERQRLNNVPRCHEELAAPRQRSLVGAAEDDD
ncbi:MAG: hypothetical protein M3R63_11560 [Actinomycetota bacterium]|nr:hypothetical protein [Actinomycetota bacterium]